MEINSNQTPKYVEESRIGLYVWQMPDGRWIGDDEGNFLNISSEKGNQKRIAELIAAVRSYGITEGEPLFLSGNRQVTDEEFEYQQQRFRLGLVPDELDVRALRTDRA